MELEGPISKLTTLLPIPTISYSFGLALPMLGFYFLNQNYYCLKVRLVRIHRWFLFYILLNELVTKLD